MTTHRRHGGRERVLIIERFRQLPSPLYYLFAGTMITRMGAFVFPYLTIYLSEARGYGFATEGAQAALRYAFTTLHLPHIISLIRPENMASIRVAERLGEQCEGRTVIYGIEALIYGLHREAWTA